MSYRTFKRLLGEASLERKCRFLFGGGLMLLITGSFWFYGRQTAKLVYDQNRMTGQQLVAPIILEKHWKWFEGDPEFAGVIDSLAQSARPVELDKLRWQLLKTDSPDPSKRPIDQLDIEMLQELKQTGASEIVRNLRDQGEYHFYGAVKANQSCLRCHARSEPAPELREGETYPVIAEVDVDTITRNRFGERPKISDEAMQQLTASIAEVLERQPVLVRRTQKGYELVTGENRLEAARAAGLATVRCRIIEVGDVDVKNGSMLGMVKIVFPLETTERALAWNNAILLATAIGTAFLAMVGAYAIVRYVIVKPVMHLKDVSEAISRGNLDQRADIRTGDEYEELSQAFNRMLRHLVAAQEELRQLNAELDGKVDELAQVNMRLFELNNLKNDFLATMTHELRTPLNSILGFSDVLASVDGLSEKQQRYVRNIQGSGKDLLNLVNDILDLAKIEAGKMDLKIIPFSLADLIERLAGMLRPLAEKRSIDLSTECDPELPELEQDSGKIQQILYNLLSNAIKFTPEGGRVQVTARRAVPTPAEDGQRPEPERVEIIVEDTGVGIPLEDQETIFEKFRQGNRIRGSDNASLTREFAGTGLGLSIVKELCKLLGGEVSVKSEVGKGSTFSVRLPVVLREQPRPLTEALGGLSAPDLAQLRRAHLGVTPTTTP